MAEPQAPNPDLEEVGKTIAGEHDRPTVILDAPVDARGLALTLIAVLAAVAALKLAQPVLVPVVFGILISYALDPVVVTMTQWRIPRGLAATLVLTALVVITGGIAYNLRDDAAAMTAQLPTVAEKLRASFEQFRGKKGDGPLDQIQQAATTIESAASAATEGRAPRGVTKVQIAEPSLKVRDLLVSGSMGVIELVAQSVVVFFLALYLLASGDLFKRKLVRIAGPSLAKRKVTVQILNDIDRQVAAFLLIRVLMSVIVAVGTWLPLRLIGLQQAALWGIIAGIVNVIPYIGPTVATAAIGLAAFMQFGSVWMMAAAAGIALAVTTLEGYWLTPWFTSRAARMNAVAVFIGLLFWGWIWGLAGLLLAVPLIMVLKAVCDRIEDLNAVGELLGE